MHRDQNGPIDSAGIIPLSKEIAGQWQVFLIQYREYRHYWGCPKGHIEPGETPHQAARRELKEETGLEIKNFLQKKPILEEFYWMKKEKRLLKRILFFVAEVSGKVHLQKDEIDNGQWFSLSKAIEQVNYPEGKTTLKQVEQLLII